MPIYEYICPKCNNKFELLCSISKAEEDANCPKCKTPSKRAISRFVSRAKDDPGYLSSMAGSGGGSSCSSCSSGSCSTCGN